MSSRLAVTAAVLAVFPCTALADDSAAFFESRIRPVLVESCSSCHGETALGALRVDSRDALLIGGLSGPAIVPGNPEASLLIQAIRHTGELKMPLDANRLKEQQIAAFEEWVRNGASWPQAAELREAAIPERMSEGERTFWSLRPLVRTLPSAVLGADWPESDVDQFILHKLEERSLAPAELAAKQALIRRATYGLIGLPPRPDEVEAFLRDESEEAFARVVDRLLASPHYGEKWARHWLDIARYGEDDDRGASRVEYPNAWRYRDWVVDAFNMDMPYDLFIEAQLAADLLDLSSAEKAELLPALGFLGLGPWYYDIAPPPISRADEIDERIDVTGRGLLGLTTACARCHDHKFDPIPTSDYYALAGVFRSSLYHELPLVDDETVKRYDDAQRRIAALERRIKEFRKTSAEQWRLVQSRRISRYLMAVAALDGASEAPEGIAAAATLDPGILERFRQYLSDKARTHTVFRQWASLPQTLDPTARRLVARAVQSSVAECIEETTALDRENEKLLFAEDPDRHLDQRFLPNRFETYTDYCPGCNVAVRPIAPEKQELLEHLFGDNGVFLSKDVRIDQFLEPEARNYLRLLDAELEELRCTAPPKYPFLHVVRDRERPRDAQLNIRGDPENLGAVVPRGFLTALSDSARRTFQDGSGRLELAEAIVNHPLAARVVTNRIWAQHFGRGIVATTSNFGQLGERPTHPDLLDFLAVQLRDSGWSIKSLHRTLMLSKTYRLSAVGEHKNRQRDEENRHYWRANRRRLDAEAVRDSSLFVSDSLDLSIGGPSSELTSDFHQRTMYGRVSRFQVNDYLTLFDFPDPSHSADSRVATEVPKRKLFLMNSDVVIESARKLARRVADEAGDSPRARLERAYALLYGRNPTAQEVNAGLHFTQSAGGWSSYLQALLATEEFRNVD